MTNPANETTSVIAVTFRPRRPPSLTKHQRRTLLRCARRMAREGNQVVARVLYVAAGCAYTETHPAPVMVQYVTAFAVAYQPARRQNIPTIAEVA